MSYGLHFGETKIMRLLKKNWTGTVATRLTHYSLHVWSCWTSCVLNNFLNAMQYFRILRSETFNPAIRIKNAPDEGLLTLNYVYRLVAHVKLSLWCRLLNSQNFIISSCLQAAHTCMKSVKFRLIITVKYCLWLCDIFRSLFAASQTKAKLQRRRKSKFSWHLPNIGENRATARPSKASLSEYWNMNRSTPVSDCWNKSAAACSSSKYWRMYTLKLAVTRPLKTSTLTGSILMWFLCNMAMYPGRIALLRYAFVTVNVHQH